MFTRFAVAAALAFATVPAIAQEMTAATYAEAMKSIIGQEFDGGIKIAGVSSEGNTLVIVLDGPANWRGALPPDAISGALLGGFCQEGNDYFAAGRTMRVDTLDAGKALQKGAVVTACPAS